MHSLKLRNRAMQKSVLDNHFLLYCRFKAINEFLFRVKILLGKVEEIV